MPGQRHAPVEPGVGTPVADRIAIMIVYEDYLTCLVAERAFERVATRLSQDGDLYLTMRSFEVLAIPALASLAADEACASDLVLFSVYRSGPWPRPMKKWMDLLGACEAGGRRGGLAALLVKPKRKERTRSGGAGERQALLEHLARLSGRDFFFARDIDWRLT